MIQVKECPNCRQRVQVRKLANHNCMTINKKQTMQTSTSHENSRSLQKHPKPKINKKYLNIQLLKPYTGEPRVKEKLFEEIKQIINYQFGSITFYNIVLNPEHAYVEAILDEVINRQGEFQQLSRRVQAVINSYEVVSFTVNEAYNEQIYKLSHKYLIIQHGSQVQLIQKYNRILQTLLSFFQQLINKPKMNKNSMQQISKRRKLSTQVLQYEDNQKSEIQSSIKSIHTFIANQGQVDCNIHTIGNKVLLIIAGFDDIVKLCKQYLLQLLSPNVHTHRKTFYLTPQQYKILQKQNILQKLKSEYYVSYSIRQLNICGTYPISDSSILYLIYSPSVLAIPKSTVIILPEKMMRDVQDLTRSRELEEYVFMQGRGDQVNETFKEYINFYVQNQAQIGLILPQSPKQKQNLLQNINQCLKRSVKRITIYLLERANQSQAIQCIQSMTCKEKKWYCLKDKKRIYYPPLVNEKIEKALANGFSNVTVTHQDLGITKQTHTYREMSGDIVHDKTKVETIVQDEGDKLIAYFQDDIYLIDKDPKAPTSVTFALFKIDPVLKQQVNLLTNQTRKIDFQTVKSKAITNNSSNSEQVKQIQLVLKFLEEETIHFVWNQIRTVLLKSQFIVEIDIETIAKEKLEIIRNWCLLNKIRIQQKNQGKTLKALSYNKTVISDLENLIQLHRNKGLFNAIQYPKFWDETQKPWLQLYTIAPHSKQYQQIQSKFKVGRIKKLERIQNKILFQKYAQERNFLTQQQGNGTKVRQLMMFHGTRMNKPQLIYADREQSFNINYANQGSFGKGIYFAKNSQYSNNYCYQAPGGRQMFFCLVLAGKSQIYNGKQIYDTSFRDAEKKIRYQSVVNKGSQEILVVFKNRRAYPLYLITY